MTPADSLVKYFPLNAHVSAQKNEDLTQVEHPSVKRILVIDDEEDIREVAQISLEMVAGWEVLTASSGLEGVAKATAQQPDAILLDVMMPDQDGPTTFYDLKANDATCHIPVILLTAKVLSTDQRQFAELGVVATIAKPFDPLLLPAQVAQVLGWEDIRHS